MSGSFEKRKEICENLKKIIGLDFTPRWQTVKQLHLLIKFLENCQNQVVIKSLGELEDEIKPSNFREFEFALYMLARHDFIEVSVPRSVVMKPRSVLKGNRWKPIRQKLSESGRTQKSAGEILLYYLQATRKDTLRIRRREDVKNLLIFQISPKKLHALREALGILEREFK